MIGAARARVAVLVLVLVVAGDAAAERRPGPTPTPTPTPALTPAPLAAASLAIAPTEAAGMLERLDGHQARVVAGRLIIDDVAGEGRPWVGVIERRGGALWLRTDGPTLLLAGPLARPRVAGPGYRAWATGTLLAGSPPTLRLRRLGILARPRQ